VTWNPLTDILFILLAYWLYRTFLEPYPRFVLEEPIDLDDPNAMERIAAVADAAVSRGNSIEVLRDGEAFYPAILDAMRAAQRSINIEVFTFRQGRIANEFAEVLCERAHAGVRVRLLPDGFGAARMAIQRGLLNRLRKAGCEVRFYHPPSLLHLELLNTRTHREIFVIDGEVAFTGGAGVADQWMTRTRRGGPRWRDTMFRIRGPAAAALQGIFVENWMAASGTILTGRREFPEIPPAGSQSCAVINSYARSGASDARIVHHVLLGSAKRKITIASPYFLPDPSVCEQLETAAARGVEVMVVTTGKKTDHALTRAGSRRLYGRLLAAGVRIYEYQRSMYHVKVLAVDDRWVVFGTANFDNRSLAIDDQVCVVADESAIVVRLQEDLRRDLKHSREITLEEWKRRPLLERVHAQLSRMLERQQ